MRYLTDSEIEKWNSRLKASYRLSPVYSAVNGNPNIAIYSKFNTFEGANTVRQYNDDPIINFSFSFSIVKDRENEFLSLFKSLLSKGFKTQIILNEDRKTGINIQVDEVLIEKAKKMNHRLFNRSFIRYSYSLNERLSKIISFFTLLDDAIKYFQMIYGYTQDGQEVKLLKFNIGDIVCIGDKKSEDYIITDYVYQFNHNGHFIDLELAEVIYHENSSISSSIITYGKVIIENIDNISHSRNNRIDNILN